MFYSVEAVAPTAATLAAKGVVKWPKYVTLQRKKAILLKRLKSAGFPLDTPFESPSMDISESGKQFLHYLTSLLVLMFRDRNVVMNEYTLVSIVPLSVLTFLC